MYKKKTCVAMLLAGGQGSRLYTLTEHVAKPAVPFGGKYRIIDFPLSNCVHSDIDTVGVLTQYQPLVLNAYIGTGQPWDLDRSYGGVTVLPPYQGKAGGEWYRGTANAIYQNLHFIRRYDPDYVLVLSGDHIYNMDYSKMLQAHREKGADVTIAVIEVPLEEASRFGIMHTDEDLRIVEFEEKPPHPKSTKASMGIYIFNTDLLTEYLIRDEADEASAKDFGKNVIPAMLADGLKMYAYPFSGYWKDVGTLDSFWEANMDLLGEHPVFDLYSGKRVFSRNEARPPQIIGASAELSDALVTEGCEIYGKVEHTVLFGDVHIAEGAVVRDSILMGDVRVEAGANIAYAILDGGCRIGAGAQIGRDRAEGGRLTVIGAGTEISPGQRVPDGAMVAAGSTEYQKED
ncbi:MAG: glucose-1-phosphate adenylyltransferase [Clostridia bacterium]|nr:glucose-1-phosphate adenylyltransferase [Clostridia bacterium]